MGKFLKISYKNLKERLAKAFRAGFRKARRQGKPRSRRFKKKSYKRRR